MDWREAYESRRGYFALLESALLVGALLIAVGLFIWLAFATNSARVLRNREMSQELLNLQTRAEAAARNVHEADSMLTQLIMARRTRTDSVATDSSSVLLGRVDYLDELRATTEAIMAVGAEQADVRATMDSLGGRLASFESLIIADSDLALRVPMLARTVAEIDRRVEDRIDAMTSRRRSPMEAERVAPGAGGHPARACSPDCLESSSYR